MEKAPCKGCPDRHENCWGSCEKYQKYILENRKIMEARKKEKDVEDLLHLRKSIKDYHKDRRKK